MTAPAILRPTYIERHVRVQGLCRRPADIEAMKHAAFEGFHSDLLLGDDDDAATAKARYERKMATIAALEEGMGK